MYLYCSDFYHLFMGCFEIVGQQLNGTPNSLFPTINLTRCQNHQLEVLQKMQTQSQFITMREGEATEDSWVALASTNPVIRDSLVEASLAIHQLTVEIMFADT